MREQQSSITALLQEAFAEASKLPKQEQDELGAWIPAELADARRWQEAFSRSRDLLDRLADQALAEHRAGRTWLLDLARM